MSQVFAWLSGLPRMVQLQGRPTVEPEPLRPQARAMTGFLSTLSAEQRKAALAYCGDDAHGDTRH
jgi:hypothetical protein